MTDEARQLSDEARALLLRTQEARQPPPGTADRQLAAVRARIEAGHTGPELEGTAPTATAAPWATKALVGLLATGALVVVAVVSWPAGEPTTIDPAIESPPVVIPEEPAAPQDEPAAMPEEPAAQDPAPAPMPEQPQAERSARPRTEPAPAPSPAAPEETQSVHLVEAELALIRPAQAALAAGQPQRALRLLAEHAKQFPSGLLSQERQVSRVVALCRLGRVQEAEQIRRRFLAAHPKSKYRRRLDEACAQVKANDM